MVDFKKRLTGKAIEKPSDPIKLYGTLDRAHDKGPLRPAQESVLADWFANHQATRDVIVKLHTGQGKTLIGLLMLQSRLNAGRGSTIYLCPDHFLIDQTREQARLFGIKTCTADPDLPEEFADGGSILITSVQKLFNGLTKFGLHRQSVPSRYHPHGRRSRLRRPHPRSMPNPDTKRRTGLYRAAHAICVRLGTARRRNLRGPAERNSRRNFAGTVLGVAGSSERYREDSLSKFRSPIDQVRVAAIKGPISPMSMPDFRQRPRD